MIGRKGMGLQWYFLIIAFFLGLGTYYAGVQQFTFKGYVGQVSLHLQDALYRAEDAQLYTSLASQSALEHALYETGKEGGGKGACGSFLGYALWTTGTDGKSSCAPSADAVQAGITSLDQGYLEQSLIAYTPLSGDIIPANDFTALIALGKPTRASLTAKLPFVIPIGKGIDITPKAGASFLQSIGLSKPVSQQAPVPIVTLQPSPLPQSPAQASGTSSAILEGMAPSSTTPILPTPISSPSSSPPSLTSAQADTILRQKYSALAGSGALFVQAEQRTQVPAAMLLAVASQESALKHCCAIANQNKDRDCQGTSSSSCGESFVLSSDFSSIGVMQINAKVNSGLASKACAPGQTVYDLECNINVGAKILRDAYLRYQNGIPLPLITRYCKDPSVAEKYAAYRGWDAAKRAYNGLGCSAGADPAYVERVNEKLAQTSPSPLPS